MRLTRAFIVYNCFMYSFVLLVNLSLTLHTAFLATCDSSWFLARVGLFQAGHLVVLAAPGGYQAWLDLVWSWGVLTLRTVVITVERVMWGNIGRRRAIQGSPVNRDGQRRSGISTSFRRQTRKLTAIRWTCGVRAHVICAMCARRVVVTVERVCHAIVHNSPGSHDSTDASGNQGHHSISMFDFVCNRIYFQIQYLHFQRSMFDFQMLISGVDSHISISIFRFIITNVASQK